MEKKWQWRRTFILFLSKRASTASVTSDARLLFEVCGCVYFYLNEDKRRLKWSASSNKTAVSLPWCFHSHWAEWPHPSTQKEKQREGRAGPGGLFYILHLEPPVDLCRHNQLHRRSSQASVPSPAPPSHTFKTSAVRQHSRAVFLGRGQTNLKSST